MNSLLLAFQFLTTLPLKIKEVNDKITANSMIFFPVAGLFIGFFLIGTDRVLSILNLSDFASNIILVITLIIITGGMHLDGLSDTADAFLSGKPKEEMLLIMRDSHAGVMGVLSLIGIILLKIGLLYSLNPAVKANALVLMCVLSRWSAVLSIFLFPYARQDGKARVFINAINPKIFIFSTLLAALFAYLIWQIRALLVMSIIAVLVYIGGKFVSKKLGGITGDTLGATVETAEVIVLFAVCIS